MSEAYRVILCTCPNETVADGITESLLQKKLVACVNRVGGVISKYWWKGQIVTDQEVLLILKTKASLFKDIEKEIQALHSYEVPEIIELPILEGHGPYLAWLKETLHS